MGVDLETGVAAGKGDWRVAPMPQWTSGTAATAENGGSSDTVLASSKNQLAAAGFLEFMNTGQARRSPRRPATSRRRPRS